MAILIIVDTEEERKQLKAASKWLHDNIEFDDAIPEATWLNTFQHLHVREADSCTLAADSPTAMSKVIDFLTERARAIAAKIKELTP